MAGIAYNATMGGDKRSGLGRIIWTDTNLDPEACAAWFLGEHPEADLSKDKWFKEFNKDLKKTLVDNLAFVRFELDIDLGSRIVCAGYVEGAGRNRVSVCKIIKSGNIADCFTVDRGDLGNEWFVDEFGDLRLEKRCKRNVAKHYLYRALNQNVTKDEIKNLKRKIYTQEDSFQNLADYLNHITYRLGDEISKIYEIPIKDVMPDRYPEEHGITGYINYINGRDREGQQAAAETPDIGSGYSGGTAEYGDEEPGFYDDSYQSSSSRNQRH